GVPDTGSAHPNCGNYADQHKRLRIGARRLEEFGQVEYLSQGGSACRDFDSLVSLGEWSSGGKLKRIDRPPPGPVSQGREAEDLQHARKRCFLLRRVRARLALNGHAETVC